MNQKDKREPLEYYLALKYPVKVQEDIDGGFTAEIEELNGCMTQAETAGEVLELVEDARRLWIEAAYEEGHDIPLPRDIQKYTGKFIVRLPASLHRKLVDLAKKEGVSLNQYVSILLTAGVTSKDFIADADKALFIDKIKLYSEQYGMYGRPDKTMDYESLLNLPPVLRESN